MDEPFEGRCRRQRTIVETRRKTLHFSGVMKLVTGMVHSSDGGFVTILWEEPGAAVHLITRFDENQIPD